MPRCLLSLSVPLSPSLVGLPFLVDLDICASRLSLRELQTYRAQGTSKELFPGCVKLGKKKFYFVLFNYCRQENAIFSPHIHTTGDAFFRGPQYDFEKITS